MASGYPSSASPSPLLSRPLPPSVTLPPSNISPSSSSSSSDAPSPSFLSSLNLSENWKFALAVALVGAVAAGSVLYLSRRGKGEGEREEGEKKEKKKEKKKEQEKKKEHDKKEEKKEARRDEKDKDKDKERDREEKEEDEVVNVEELSGEERNARAKKCKDKGNKYFSGKNYEKAIELYTDALRFQPSGAEAAVFYSNRAACHSNLNNHHQVIADCTSALAIDKKYVKALNRRAIAYENLEQFKDALVDITAACILDGFKNEGTLKNADRLIKQLGNNAAKEYFTNRTLHLPAEYFLTAYFDSFRNKYESTLEEVVWHKEGDDIYRTALKHLEEKEYEKIMEPLNKAIELQTNFRAQALNLRGTLKYLQGDFEGSLEDFDKSLVSDEKSTNSLIKRASVKFEQKNIEGSFADFDQAITINPNDPDIYYHRGQAHFIASNLEGAMQDYLKAIELDSSIPFVHVQLAVIYFRSQAIQKSLETFKNALEKFPKYGDLYNYYGEVLTELGRFEEANENFEKALEMNPKNPLSLINKAFLIARWKEDQDQAITLLKKAIEIDPKCELAYAHLGQLYIQANNLNGAIDAYKSAIECSRTEAEIAQWYSCIEAAQAQSRVLEVYPEIKQVAGFGN